MWRPNRWKNPDRPHKETGVGCRAPDKCEGCNHDTYEAGADAMLGAAMGRVIDKIQHDFYLEHIYPCIKPNEQEDAIVIHIPKKRVPLIMRELKSIPSELLEQ